MPSYGRPERLQELLKAPGGWPTKVTVLVNEDDPKRDAYLAVLVLLNSHPWKLEFIPGRVSDYEIAGG